MRPLSVQQVAERKRALRISQVASRLACDPSHVYRLIRSEGLPSFKLGPRGTRVWEHELERWEANRPSGVSSDTEEYGQQPPAQEPTASAEVSAPRIARLLSAH